MRKSKKEALTQEQIERVIAMAQEEKKPFEVIKAEFGISENEVTELLKKTLSKDNFELWKKKVSSNKPKPKVIKIDEDFDDLDEKYYIKNKFD
jgi:uncharacterized protein (TIGR03643 family)